jgi:hypothetical protein
MMVARELAQSLIEQRLTKWNGQSESGDPGAKQFYAVSLVDSVAGRANLLATQEVAWAKLSTLPSPREIAWARCKTKVLA